MKRITKFGFALSLIISANTYSANPVQGWYFGFFGQLSHGPNDTLTTTVDTPYGPQPLSGNLTLSPVGGGAGASIGYKINMFRVEGELLFNINNYGEFQAGSCTLISPNVVGPEGNCPIPIDQDHAGLGFNGNKMGFYGLVNGFYDFTSSDPNVNFVPFLGVGLGGAMIRNHAVLKSNKYAPYPLANSYTIDSSNGAFAVQGLAGFYYYLDDITTMGLDFRYISAMTLNKNNNSNTSQYGISTINLTFTFALEKGQQ